MKSDGPPNRVLMTTDTIGGVWTYAIDLSRGLCRRGIQITLAAMGAEPSSAQHAEAAAIDGLVLEARPFKLEWMEEPWEDIAQASTWLRGLAERVRPELVHLNTLAHGAIEWDAPVLSVGHSCVMSWFEAVKGQAAPDQWERYRDVVRSSLRASDIVVAPSATMMRALQRHYGPLARTHVVYNGRNPDDFMPASPEPIVLSAGRLWDDAKNVRALAEAAGDIRWPVFVAGSAAHPDGGSVDLAGVEMLGQLDSERLAGWYARASIYALPARYEPFGLTALEAALAGNALVLGDIESLREIWGDAAVFVDPERPAEVADAVNALIDDPGKRRELAERARRRAFELTVDAMAERYTQLYRELCGATVRGPATLTTRGGRH